MEEKEMIMDRIKQIKENLNDIEREKNHQEKLMEVFYFIFILILCNRKQLKKEICYLVD